MKYHDIKDLPVEHLCKLCGETKPINEMSVVYIRREKYYKLRPRCKNCHNESERGHRREYKRKYLQNWRKRNSKVNESYWKDNPIVREQARLNAQKRLKRDGEAVAIQRRMNKRGMGINIAEARELLEKYGRCYPTNFGLTEKGRREVERIRTRKQIRKSKRLNNFQIRLMVYEDGIEDGFVIPPELQPIPYEKQAARGRQLQRNKRILLGETDVNS